MLADVFEEFLSPVLAAQGLLHTAVAKRKEVLSKTMGFVVQLLSSEITPQMKDGALHIIGSVADVLLQVNLLIFCKSNYLFVIFL